MIGFFYIPSVTKCPGCKKDLPKPYEEGPKGSDHAGKNLCGACYVDALHQVRNKKLAEQRAQGEPDYDHYRR